MAGNIVTAETFIQKLQTYNAPLVFNPWQNYDPECDIGPEAPKIRAANLLRCAIYSCVRARTFYSSPKGWATRAGILAAWP